jgi:competence protein ComEA
VTQRGGRLALCCLALLLSAVLLVKGRAPTWKGGDAAFFVPSRPGSVTVRLTGDFPHPGVYHFPDGTLAGSAIIMTLPGVRLSAGSQAAAGVRLTSGDVLKLRGMGRQPAVLAMERMPARERMLLGIPLDPDLLGIEEWALLPGIGPVLAARIVNDRQINGAFGSLDAVARVPGIAAGKLTGVRRYF